MSLQVAGAQIPVTDSIEATAETILRAIDHAASEQADVLLTPEGSLSGYRAEFDGDELAAALETVLARATSAKLALALGTCFVEPDDGRCYNQIRFYDGGGKLVGFHTKTLLCGSLGVPSEGEINAYGTRPLQTFELCGIRVGGLICNDMWANPLCTPMDDSHLSQRLAQDGARVIFHAVNGGRGQAERRDLARQYQESNLRMRAIAGKLWIVTVDNCHPPEYPCASPGGVIDPQGRWALRAEIRGEQLFTHTIELDD